MKLTFDRGEAAVPLWTARVNGVPWATVIDASPAGVLVSILLREPRIFADTIDAWAFLQAEADKLTADEFWPAWSA